MILLTIGFKNKIIISFTVSVQIKLFNKVVIIIFIIFIIVIEIK